MPEVTLNYLAILVAAVLNMAVGMIWYSPLLFASSWLAEIGKKKEDVGSPNAGYAIATVSALIMAYVLAHFVGYLGAESFAEGARTGLWAWLGFVAASFATDYVFHSRSRKLYLINVGYNLVALMLMGGLLAVWR